MDLEASMKAVDMQDGLDASNGASKKKKKKQQQKTKSNPKVDDDHVHKKSPAARPSLPVHKLFSYADGLDYVLMAVGGVAAAVHGAALPVFFIVFAHLIHAFGETTSTREDALGQLSNEIHKDALDLVYLSIARLVSGWLEVSLWMYTGERQATKIRMDYLRALLSQDVGFFDTDVTTAEIVVGICSDTALIQQAIGSRAGSIIHYFAQFITGFAIAFTTLWKLTFVTLSLMPLIVMSGCVIAYIIVGLANRSQNSYRKASEVAQEVISQIRTVQAFVGEEKACRAYGETLVETERVGRRAGLMKGVGVGMMYGLGFYIFAFLLWYAGIVVRQGKANGADAFATILNVITSSLALGQAAPDVALFSKATVSGHTIMEMIRRTPSIGNAKGEGLKLKAVKGHIELRDIHFSYPSRPDITIFRKLSLSIPAGKVAAIVGGSGSGKSTVISLIERFYDPTLGEVLLDGHNIKDLQLKWLREQMALVNQEPALFATSISENILYGKDGGASMDEVIKAASLSCAHDFIVGLPKGYETEVGEAGSQLSGGQKQRIAIARALLKNPSILLLDEATSALDAESEKSVQEALDHAMLGRTTVVVAHRLSTVQSADAIAVLQHGKVVEIGTHEELLAKAGAYASLVKLQEGAACHKPANGERHDRISRGSFSGSFSLSHRTFSFRSTAESTVASAGHGVKGDLDIDELVFSSPSLRRVVRMHSKEWPWGLLGAIGAIIAGAQTPILGFMITQALECFYSDEAKMKTGLAQVAELCFGAGTLAILAYSCEFYFSGVAGESITRQVRKKMFSAILHNEIGWFDRNSSTVLSSRLCADATMVRTVIVDRITTLFQNLGLIVTALVLAFKLQWQLAAVIVAMFPAMLGAFAGQVQFMKGFGADNSAYARANMVAGEAVTNIRTVAAFGAEDKVMALFSRELQDTQKHSFVRGQAGGLGFGLSQFFLFSSFALAFWYGAILIQEGKANFGQVVKCFVILIFTAFGIGEALSLAPDIMKSGQTLGAVYHILDRRSEIDANDPKSEEVSEVKGSIEFRNVGFSYPTRADVQVFKDFNLKIRRGQSLALVGASGSGKSSIIGLIARFYDPQAGRVIIDGKDLKSLKLKSVRQHMGLVQQEPALFSTSIYENIQYGKEDATQSEIEEAAKAANAHSFITGLPNGYNTQVGERGVQLSGGQKQRVAIARAVLRNPAILLLDEATSALDAASEKLVQAALDKLMQRRTTVVVAHRLCTIQNAQSIAVLESGSIVEQGSHTELLAKQGSYFQLLNLSQEDNAS